MKKILLTALAAASLPLFAAVDAAKSYFTVSTHQPGVNTPVEIKIFLRNADNQPCDAKLRTKPAGKIAKIGTGVYTCTMSFSQVGEKITPQIFADKFRIRENLLPDKPLTSFANAYTNNKFMTELAHENGKLRILNFGGAKCSAVWTFGSIEKDSYLRDRHYLLSADIQNSDLISGKGAAAVMSGRNAQNKSVSGRYGAYVNNESVRRSSLLVPRGEVSSASFGIHASHTESKTLISDVQLEVVPTFVVQNTPGKQIKFTPATAKQRIYKNYNSALIPVKKQLDAAVEKAGRQGVKISGLDVLKIPKQISATAAFELKKAMLAKIKELETSELEAQKQMLASGFIAAPPQLLAPEVRAAIAPKGKLSPFYTNFRLMGNYGKFKELKPGIAFGYDKNNLFVTVNVPGKPEIVKGKGVHDDTTMWERTGDKVELFINIPGTRGYCQLATAPGGQKYDEAEGDAFVNFKWDVKITLKKNSFLAAYTIPWSELGIDPDKEKEFRMNCVVTKCSTKGKMVHCWSFATTGYREYESMGFVILGKLPAGVSDYIAWKNREIEKAHAASTAAAKANVENMRKNAVDAVSFNWNNDNSFEKDPVFQIRLISQYLASPAPAKAEFKIAVNEFAYRTFAIGAIKADLDAKILFSDLKSADGKRIPKENLSLTRTVFLEPREDIWPKWRQKWSGRPLPELFEKVENSTLIKQFSLAQFRLYIDSRNCVPGKYSGSIKVGSLNIPVNCEIMPITLPRCEDKVINCYIFTQLPWGGKSGEDWAKLLQEHYVGDVSFETPRVMVDGVHVNCVKSCRCTNGGSPSLPGLKNGKYKGIPWTWDGYIKAMQEYKTPAGSKVVIDGKRYDFDDRVRICAKYNLRMVLSNRSGNIMADHIKYLVEHLKKLGLPPANFTYKLGDEDPEPLFLPVAKHLRSMNLGININMIPSGAKYWDLKPLMDGFTCMDYSAAAMTIDEQGQKDIQYMRSKGFPIRRYTNRTSWAERNRVMSGRRDLWDVVIGDNLDGMVVWTASPSCWLNYSLGYGSKRNVDWKGLPPENQHACQLVYWRKQGDYIKPISSLRLEDLRDGVTDSLYYREAVKLLTARKNDAGLKKLKEIAHRSKYIFSDYEKARAEIVELILQNR